MNSSIQIDLATQLLEQQPVIVGNACEALKRARLKHYQSSEAQNAERLRVLFERVVRCAGTKSLLPMVTYAEQLAHERYAAGFDLSEVQTAFNVLEESIWQWITAHVQPSEYPHALGMTSAILGAGKEALAREYVSLACSQHVASLYISALFAGA